MLEILGKIHHLHAWSSHQEAVDLGIIEPLDCDACGHRRAVRLWFLYEYCTMAWIFGIVSRRTYALVCGHCGARREIPEWEVEGRQTKPVRIPFMRRFGLVLIIGLPFLWFFVYIISEFLSLLL